jgi:VWFA-related protein
MKSQHLSRLELTMPRLLCAALVVAISIPVAASQQQPTFRGGGDTVRVFVTVTEGERLVPGLTREKFEVRDDGKAQPITVFDNSPVPIQLVIMLDVSGSMSQNLSLLRGAADALFAKLGPEDVAKVGTFGNEITISPKFTRDRVELRAALPTEIPESGRTPLWRAVSQAIGAFDDENKRHVVLVLSDGHDSGVMFGSGGGKLVTQMDVIEGARTHDVMIYGVGMRSRVYGVPGVGPGGLSASMNAGMPDPGLGRVALESGGGYLELRPREELSALFTRVMEELHSQYLLGFSPPKRDGKKHDLDVRLTERGMKVRARTSYIAPAAK